MFKLKRNQVIITALVVMIAIAGYLNYTDQGPNIPQGFTYNEDGSMSALITNLTEAELIPVDGPIIPTAPVALEEDEEVTFVNIIDGGTFFVQARLNREQDRARQREVLLDLINNENISSEIRAQSAENMLTIQRRIEKESAAEALIESRGFNEVYVRIGDNSVDVIVNKDSLTDAELAQIEDVIKRKVGVDSGVIRISPMRSTNNS
ncbi:MAG: SpoIIIAH-like family protein [Defluviitaleaceae bacterium]|nr:SpoIIIAH-like family protein [Defluviitaleaceae bacterium]